jgi:ADP-ribosylglycohydrolase
MMTIAVADAVMRGDKVTLGCGTDSYESVRVAPNVFIDAMKKWGRLYPKAGYGRHFGRWLGSDDCEPYNSWGNGSAMRVAACGWVVPIPKLISIGFDGILDIAKASAEVTHNHPEGIKGAQATAMAIYYARHGKVHSDPDTVKKLIRRDLGNSGDSVFGGLFGYDLSRTLDEIRPKYRYHISCQKTVPEAIIAFLESTGFEDAVRNAVSLGGDSDTLTAITGSIAEAAYGIPRAIADEALSRLDAPLRQVYEQWRTYCKWYSPLLDG